MTCAILLMEHALSVQRGTRERCAMKNVIITRLVGTVALCVATVSMAKVAITWTEVAQMDATPGGLIECVIKNVPLGSTVTIVKRIVALTVEFLGCVTEKLEVVRMHVKMDGKEANVSGSVMVSFLGIIVLNYVVSALEKNDVTM
uniref:Uncharacterized protein LOC111113438 n=1 Tax=Crassostrea virginica TaxID=6565 RepID=A0A8B8BVX6_CRAVI|nr:uncharacterized protein LOC111113438 [Crassostrea virginica]